MRFQTDFRYSSRSDKPEYVWRKYGELLEGSVLDVGADRCGLQDFLPAGTDYLGIGLGRDVDERVDFETDSIPYPDGSFECVVCLDVLEHLDNIHEIFDELCRVSNRHVIISIPNPWAAFMGLLRDGYYDGPGRPLKFYNLPTDPPDDRHKWFYGAHEGERFLRERAERNGLEVLQIDREESVSNPYRRAFYHVVLRFVLNDDVDVKSLTSGNVWAALEK